MKLLILEQIIYPHQKILEICSSNTWLHYIALIDIFKVCIENDIKIMPTWIPLERKISF